MVRAVVTQGEIRPLDPLPPDWKEGQRVSVEKADEIETSVVQIDKDFATLAAMCQDNDPEDEQRREIALQEARRKSKDQVRREMGLPFLATQCSASLRLAFSRRVNLKKIVVV